LLVGAGVGVAAGAVTAGMMTGTSESGENTPTTGGTPSGSIARYMQYRSSSAKSTGGAEHAATDRPVIKETSQVENGSDSVKMADQGSSGDNDVSKSKSKALLVGAGGAVAAGAVTAGIMTGKSESGESTSTPSGTPSGSIPRYMQYRTSLACSADASTRADQADKTGQLSRAPTDNETPSVVESSGGSDTGESDSSFSSTEGEFNSNAALVGAGIATAGAATAGVLSGTSDGAKAAPSAEQAPLLQRHGYARRLFSTIVRSPVIKETSRGENESDSVKAADQCSSEDNDEPKSKALLVGAGVGVAAGAVTAGMMTGTSESGENISTPSGTPSGSIPRYMQYRTSLARSTDFSTIACCNSDLYRSWLAF
jgi:hypothetical protein